MTIDQDVSILLPSLFCRCMKTNVFLLHYNPSNQANEMLQPPFQPMLPQPHLPPAYGYYNQPSIGGYNNPVYVFVQPNQPQPGYHATNFYNPVIGPVPFSIPQFLGQDPFYQFGQPSMGFHSLNSGVPSASLSDNIVKQIEYYFSDENLPHDYYLISLMDDQGWVPISTVAKFKRVERMCTDTPFILDSLLFGSRLVEVQGNKIRRRRAGACSGNLGSESHKQMRGNKLEAKIFHRQYKKRW
ncbi:hypothetical protein ACLB2K_042871 [Fragaria x ananassa]